MKKMKWKLFRYYRQIHSWLPCTWRQKNRFIRELSGNIQAFLEQTPNADMETIQERFGTPQQIASAYVDETDTPQLLKSLRIRRRIVGVVLTVAIAVLILYTIVLICELYIFHDTFGGCFVEEIEEIATFED